MTPRSNCGNHSLSWHTMIYVLNRIELRMGNTRSDYFSLVMSLRISAYGVIGNRPSMQDGHFSGRCQRIDYMGVSDGHHTDKVMCYIRDHFHQVLDHQLSQRPKRPFHHVISSVFGQLNTDIIGSLGSDANDSGATLSVLFFTKKNVYCANVGDSDVYAKKAGLFGSILTRDHHPTLFYYEYRQPEWHLLKLNQTHNMNKGSQRNIIPQEYWYKRTTGSYYMKSPHTKRLINLTRALGDHIFRNTMISRPFISRVPRGTYAHFCVASDGWWDYMNADITFWDYVRIIDELNPARELVEDASVLHKLHDNTTLMLCTDNKTT